MPKKPKRGPTLKQIAEAAVKDGVSVSFELIPNEKCCASCAFGKAFLGDPAKMIRCRRFPRVHEDNKGYLYPRHFDSDWCGEFKDKEVK